MFTLKSRFYLLLILIFLISSFPIIHAQEQSPSAVSQQINPQAVSQQINPQAAKEQILLIDDNSAEGRYGGTGNPGFGWFNLLKPDNYPATLKEVRIAFSDGPNGVLAGSPIRIVVYRDPEGDGPSDGQQPVAIFPVTVNKPGNFDSYELPQPITIDSGAFIIGALDTIFIANLPAFGDATGLVKPVGSKSYFTLDSGRNFFRVDQNFPNFQLQPVTWLIRGVADVEGLAPVVNRAFYKKETLKVFGRNFAGNAIVRINGKRIDRDVKFAASLGRLIVKGTTSELNLKPSGQNNKLVIVVDGVASDSFDFTS
ncbi:MAG: hypothetical protein HY819_14990 [Acidobacteria bacterium]|nr:hypothetical protein [Acidobacteriota bacterium]